MKDKQQQRSGHPLPERFTLHEDAAHGWLEVPYALLQTLEITDKISAFSYRKDDTAYLEEDADLTIFAKAYLVYLNKQKDDFLFFRSIVDHFYDGDQSRIRTYIRYFSNKP